jgi:SHS2 domain-containing protein
MATFKIIEEGAFGDYEFEAEAESLEKLFSVCALATFEAVTDVSEVAAIEARTFDISAESLEELLYLFLAELICIKDTENIFFSRFEISIGDKFKLSCKASGERINGKKHTLKTDVKAVTYHKLEVGKKGTGYGAHVILDL